MSTAAVSINNSRKNDGQERVATAFTAPARPVRGSTTAVLMEDARCQAHYYVDWLAKLGAESEARQGRTKEVLEGAQGELTRAQHEFEEDAG